MTAVIEVRKLEKRFGPARALDGLDLAVNEGEVHGFLGPNGAGKSTTIRILLGLVRASSGAARVFGSDPWNAAARLRKRIAYVPGDVALWPNLSGGEAIDIISRLRGEDTNTVAFRASRERLLDAFQLDPGKKSRAYSKGNRQKVALVAALATPADLYILDEPTSGLDPVMEAVFGREVVRLSQSGASILLSSHILSEIEALCDRVSIIRAGKTVESGTLAAMRHLSRTEVSFSAEGIDPLAAKSLPGAQDVAERSGRVHLTVESADMAALLPGLAELRVQSLTIAPPSLEELFLRHYGEDAARDTPVTPATPSAPSAAAAPSTPAGQTPL